MKVTPSLIGNSKLTHQPDSIRSQSVFQSPNHLTRVALNKTVEEEMRHDPVVLSRRPVRRPRILAEEINPCRIACTLPCERNHFRTNFHHVEISQRCELKQSRKRASISFAQYQNAPRCSQPWQKGEPSAFKSPAESRILNPAIPPREPSDPHRNSSGVSSTASAKTQRASPEIVRPQRASAASAAALIVMAANQVELLP